MDMKDSIEELRREIIELSLATGALVLSPNDPFKWASGYLMPVYNDNRILLSFPRGRELVREGFLRIVRENVPHWDGVAGTASAGIAPATLLADNLKTRLYYIRPQRKSHGSKRIIEGGDPASLRGKRLILVEDLVSTAGSSAAAAEELNSAGATVAACVAIFSYGFDVAVERFSQLQDSPPAYPLVTFGDLLNHANRARLLPDEELSLLRRWSDSPFTWKQQSALEVNHG